MFRQFHGETSPCQHERLNPHRFIGPLRGGFSVFGNRGEHGSRRQRGTDSSSWRAAAGKTFTAEMLSNARRNKTPKFRTHRGDDAPSSPVWICVWVMAAVTYLGSSYYYADIASMNDHAAIGTMPNLVDAAFVLLPPRPSESEPVLEALRQWGAKNPLTPLVVSHSHARDMELLRAAHAGISYSALEVTHGQILIQSPTNATSSR